jgi:hypothetical protein
VPGQCRQSVTLAGRSCLYLVALQLDEMPTSSRTRTRALSLFQRWLEHPRAPAVLALGAVLVMLPALKLGLVMDDLPQRMVALPPDRVPPRIHDLDFPLNSGSFFTVTRDFFFGFYRDQQGAALARSYGMFPWWTPASATIGLWRPVTAFTHWLDYQLYPDWPALMHAQNIAWFAAVVFLVTVIYRKLMGPGWAAGLAGLLFLLDYNTYFPVAFVANRGFILSLFLGLACLYQHHQWRAERRRSGLLWSALFLALSVFANEGGASTLAFILALATALYGVPLVAALLVFAPWLRRDKTAAFWCAVMLLAAIPAATVVPLGKNLGFVAVGACGLITSFLAGLRVLLWPLPDLRSLDLN